MVAALNCFVSRSADRCTPFFQLLHKWKDLARTKECDRAFEGQKKYLTHFPFLSKPENEEVLCAYIAITAHVVSLVLIRTEEGLQKPVYYVSKSLQETETWYLPLEKAILAIIHTTKKLPYYFQAHTAIVLTQLPLQASLQKSDFTRRVAKWGTILGVFDIKYLPQTAIKGQVLADLVAESTEGAK